MLLWQAAAAAADVVAVVPKLVAQCCLVVHISNNQSGINGWCRRQRVETRTHGNYKRNGRKYEKREKEERNKLMWNENKISKGTGWRWLDSPQMTIVDWYALLPFLSLASLVEYCLVLSFTCFLAIRFWIVFHFLNHADCKLKCFFFPVCVPAAMTTKLF